MPAHIAISTLYIVQKYRRTEGRKYKVQKDRRTEVQSTKYRRTEGRKDNVQSTEGEVRCKDATCGVRDNTLTASAEGASGSESRK